MKPLQQYRAGVTFKVVKPAHETHRDKFLFAKVVFGGNGAVIFYPKRLRGQIWYEYQPNAALWTRVGYWKR